MKGAAAKLRAALELEPDDEGSYRAYNDLARALVGANRFEEAARRWQEALAIGEQAQSETRRIVLRAWGGALVERQDYEGAAAKLRAALELEPDDEGSYRAYNDLARALVGANRFEEAARRWQEALAIGEQAQSETRRIVLRAWGDSLKESHRLDEALDKYLQALALDPDDSYSFECFNRLAQAFAQIGRFEDVAAVFQRAREKLESSAEWARTNALGTWGWTLRSLGFLDEAAETLGLGLNVSANDPFLCNNLGLVLADQGQYKKAIQQYRKANEIWQKQDDAKNRKFPLSNWADALVALERFEEAAVISEQAIAADPGDFWQYFNRANILSASDRFGDALAAIEKAISCNREHLDNGQYDDPYPHHNRSAFLFELGRYEKGWPEWRVSKDSYERAIDKGSEGDTPELASFRINYGNVLCDIFGEYAAAERHYKKAIESQSYEAATWRGLAVTYQKWASVDDSPADIQARLSHALQHAIQLSSRQLGKGNDFPVLLALADLHIETRDWIAARACLENAADLCKSSRLKRAQIDRRQGLLDFRADRFTEAVESFRKAANVRPSDLELRSNLGKALLGANRFAEAQLEFSRVLKGALGEVDALIGAARVCIELAEEGETEYYVQAERRLYEALQHGQDDTGSMRLKGSRLEEVYYLRGYARTKRWELEGVPLTLLSAWRDFKQCPGHPQATAAKAKIKKYLSHQAGASLLPWLGSRLIFCAATAVFTFVQLDFFFPDWLVVPKKNIEEPLPYATISFGALLFMMAALYLPQILKFKVAGIELEKTAAQVSAPTSLGITLSAEGFRRS